MWSPSVSSPMLSAESRNLKGSFGETKNSSRGLWQREYVQFLKYFNCNLKREDEEDNKKIPFYVLPLGASFILNKHICSINKHLYYGDKKNFARLNLGPSRKFQVCSELLSAMVSDPEGTFRLSDLLSGNIYTLYPLRRGWSVNLRSGNAQVTH